MKLAGHAEGARFSTLRPVFLPDEQPAFSQGIFSAYRAEKGPGQFLRKSFFARPVDRNASGPRPNLRTKRGLTTPAAARPPLGQLVCAQGGGGDASYPG